MRISCSLESLYLPLIFTACNHFRAIFFLFVFISTVVECYPISYAASKNFRRIRVATLHNFQCNSNQRCITSLNSHEEFITFNQLSANDISFVEIVPPQLSMAESIATTFIDNLNVNTSQFASVFRNCAPYIAMHRGSIMVIHITGRCLNDKTLFDAVMDDVSILHLLGVKIVLTMGVRERIDLRLLESGEIPIYRNGMRVTDDKALKHLKEESGSVRYEVESALSRGFQGMAGKSGINVVSGNFFYSAKPLGVRDGIDFKFTGEVRRIEVENFKRRLDSGDIVLITSLGYSSSGEVFNVPSESLAAECAIKLEASKIIFLTEGQLIMDRKINKPVQNFRLPKAIALLESNKISRSLYKYLEEDKDDMKGTFSPLRTASFESTNSSDGNPNKRLECSSQSNRSNTSIANDRERLGADRNDVTMNTTGTSNAQYIRTIARCVYALTGGVKRAHLVPPIKGALLTELFTRDGSGVLISRDAYEGVRQANEADLRSVIEIIKPLEEEGILIHRPVEQLEKELSNCFLLTRDNATLACGMIKQYSESHAEIYCLAVHPSYRRAGRGETLLAYLERRALVLGVTHVFVLSTRTMQWFEERGFVLSDPSVLPPNRQINQSRGSKVYIKKLGSERDVDSEELLWNIM